MERGNSWVIADIRKPRDAVLKNTLRDTLWRQEKVEQEGRTKATEGRGQTSWLRTRVLWHPYAEECTPVCVHVLMCTLGRAYTQAG